MEFQIKIVFGRKAFPLPIIKTFNTRSQSDPIIAGKITSVQF